MRSLVSYVAAAAVLTWASAGAAKEAFFEVPVRDLQLTAGKLPTGSDARIWSRSPVDGYFTRAVFEGDAEGYLQLDERPINSSDNTGARIASAGRLLVRSGAEADVKGTLYLRADDEKSMVRLPFVIPAARADAQHRESFYKLKQQHYERLAQENVPGTAWFRHQARLAAQAIHKESKPGAAPQTNRWRDEPELVRTYDLFSGGRAVSENLQLDRALPPPAPKEKLVRLDSVQGITVREFDWKPLIKDAHPQLDPLAASLPADQHAVFFPTFQAAVDLMDNLAQQGTLFLGLADPRSEDTGLVHRYQKQLGLSIGGVGRLLGPHLVRSIAATGSDTNFPTGTDLAILLEADQPQALADLLWAQVTLTAKLGSAAKELKGTIHGLKYRAMVAEDRSVSSYVATLDKAVVVTNSLHQLEQLALVKDGKIAALATVPEYTFFRMRSRRGEANESALAVLTDATIRRWCGPRWRIGESRRTRGAALLAELQAAQLDKLVQGKIQTGPLHTDLSTYDVGDVQLTPQGVVSSKLGSLSFLTPIAELPLDEALQGEVEAYNRWREGYERYWTGAFDPIALRLSLTKAGLAADLTVTPLILRSEYRKFSDIVRGAKIAPHAGDPHQALFHAAIALDLKSPMVGQANNMAQMMLSGPKFDPLGWIGSSIALYVDEDSFWHELAKQPTEEREKFLQRQAGRIPLALVAEVSSGLRLTAFLAGLRGMIEQSAPGMVTWEALTYKDQAYVKVAPTEQGKAMAREVGELAVFYAPSAEQLIVTLREDVLRRALDRRAARRLAEKQGQPLPQTGPAWLGESMAITVDRRAIDALSNMFHDEYRTLARTRAWSNLPILNHWRRRFPAQDALAVHGRFWQSRLLCPGGGKYVWNDQWQTYESTVFGHPGEPKPGPAAPPQLFQYARARFGVTFEHDGLRARVALEK